MKDDWLSTQEDREFHIWEKVTLQRHNDSRLFYGPLGLPLSRDGVILNGLLITSMVVKDIFSSEDPGDGIPDMKFCRLEIGLQLLVGN